jgi:hypothetical protein
MRYVRGDDGAIREEALFDVRFVPLVAGETRAL